MAPGSLGVNAGVLHINGLSFVLVAHSLCKSLSYSTVYQSGCMQWPGREMSLGSILYDISYDTKPMMMIIMIGKRYTYNNSLKRQAIVC